MTSFILPAAVIVAAAATWAVIWSMWTARLAAQRAANKLAQRQREVAAECQSGEAAYLAACK